MHNYLTNVSFDTPTELVFGGLFENETGYFIDCIIDDTKQCKTPTEDGIELTKMLDAVYKSAATGHEVSVL